MLYPQNNTCRSFHDLSGIWRLKPDPQGIGEQNKWQTGFETDVFVGIPGSWNEQLAEIGMMNYVGKVWYQKSFFVNKIKSDHKLYLRFGAVDFNSRVWINGKLIGEKQGAYLPFEFNITEYVKQDAQNLLIVCVDNILNHDSIPQGISEADFAEFNKQRELSYPSTLFDFFAYGGITRKVHLYTRPKYSLQHLEVNTKISGSNGRIKFILNFTELPPDARVHLKIMDDLKEIISTDVKPNQVIFEAALEIKNCKFWDIQNPHLYSLEIRIFAGDSLVDEFYQNIGIREVQIKNNQLLLNGKQVFLNGFGKHEDFAVLGKGLSYPLIIKDFELMRWIGANSFRTSHYPYAEEIMQLADRMGFLVIDEVPAVSLNFRYVNKNTLENHKKSLAELIVRDRNHPSVIAWSIANEPGIWGEQEAISPAAEKYWTDIYNYVKHLDNSRPITLPACAKWGLDDLSYRFSDFISINRYWGWYEVPGDIEAAGKVLEKELIALFEMYQKPIMLTEFGADTMEGLHATYPQMFTEEYQTSLILKYFEIIEKLPFTIGEHIWNFADFRTAQHHRRVVLNKKGVFNRQREPKSAAFAIREHWLKKSN